ncbi:MAG: deoxyribodipyrimidine photo-lyase, partial [Gammaproteobacteria bacterium]|nr:deoxyribodipyrimidine photo-lyase [Gammaproteobacteria bacterium]
EPDVIRNQSGSPYKVFTPFWKACCAATEPHLPRPAPKQLRPFDRILPSANLDDWQLLPTNPNWATGIAATWQPGEQSAHQRLQQFVNESMADYKEGRDRPDKSLTSRLSPYLHFGEITPRQIWHVVQPYLDRADHEAGARCFLSEIGWREFSYHLLFHFSDFPEQPFRKNFLSFPWVKNDEALERWQLGQTGYPMVDAGMRELWHTGWMHNRIRMIAASFLVKHLLIHWQAGETWFWDTLVDADLASNSASWQWVAGCGADAAPYFRIFNPITQGQKFDPDGAYVKQWIPEIAQLSTKYIHAPWQAPAQELKDAGVKLGDNYPEPIVDHSEARQRALAAFEQAKKVA